MKKFFCLILFVCCVVFANAKQPEPPVPNAVVLNTCGAPCGIYVDNFIENVHKVPFKVYFHLKKSNEWEKDSSGELKSKNVKLPKMQEGESFFVVLPVWQKYDYVAIEVLPEKASTIYKEQAPREKPQAKKRAAGGVSISFLVFTYDSTARSELEELQVASFDIPKGSKEEILLDFDYEVENYGRAAGNKNAFTIMVKNARIKKSNNPDAPTVSYFGRQITNVIPKQKGNVIKGDCQIVLQNPGSQKAEYKIYGCNKKTKEWIEFGVATAKGDDGLVLADAIHFDDFNNCLCFSLEKDSEACDATYEVDVKNKSVIFTIE